MLGYGLTPEIIIRSAQRLPGSLLLDLQHVDSNFTTSLRVVHQHSPIPTRNLNSGVAANLRASARGSRTSLPSTEDCGCWELDADAMGLLTDYMRVRSVIVPNKNVKQIQMQTRFVYCLRVEGFGRVSHAKRTPAKDITIQGTRTTPSFSSHIGLSNNALRSFR